MTEEQRKKINQILEQMDYELKENDKQNKKLEINKLDSGIGNSIKHKYEKEIKKIIIKKK